MYAVVNTMLLMQFILKALSCVIHVKKTKKRNTFLSEGNKNSIKDTVYNTQHKHFMSSQQTNYVNNRKYTKKHFNGVNDN